MAPVAETKKEENRGAHLKKGVYSGAPRGRKIGAKRREQERVAAGGKKRGRKPGQKNAAKK